MVLRTEVFRDVTPCSWSNGLGPDILVNFSASIFWDKQAKKIKLMDEVWHYGYSQQMTEEVEKPVREVWKRNGVQPSCAENTTYHTACWSGRGTVRSGCHLHCVASQWYHLLHPETYASVGSTCGIQQTALQNLVSLVSQTQPVAVIKLL